MTVVEAPGDVITTYQYDLENRQISVEAEDGITTFTYNALGERVRRETEDGTTTEFLHDGANLRQESVSGVVDADYTVAPQPQLQPYGDLVSQNRASESSFYHFDAIGTTAAISDLAQWLSDQYLFEAFGKLVSDTGTTTNPFGFDGRLLCYTDPESSLIDMRARKYEPSTARFTTADPIGFAAGESNFYILGGNNPNKTDPGGLEDPYKLQQQIADLSIEILRLKKSPAANRPDIAAKRWQLEHQFNALKAKQDPKYKPGYRGSAPLTASVQQDSLAAAAVSEFARVAVKDVGAAGHAATVGLVTGDTQRAVVDRAIAVTEQGTGQEFTGSLSESVALVRNTASEATGITPLTEAAFGVDVGRKLKTQDATLDNWEIAERTARGFGSFGLSVAAPVAGMASKSAGAAATANAAKAFVSKIPGVARVGRVVAPAARVASRIARPLGRIADAVKESISRAVSPVRSAVKRVAGFVKSAVNESFLGRVFENAVENAYNRLPQSFRSKVASTWKTLNTDVSEFWKKATPDEPVPQRPPGGYANEGGEFEGPYDNPNTSAPKPPPEPEIVAPSNSGPPVNKPAVPETGPGPSSSSVPPSANFYVNEHGVAFSKRAYELGLDPKTGFRPNEGLGGSRLERQVGRPIERYVQDADFDFIDKGELGGRISLKGPLVGRDGRLLPANVIDKQLNSLVDKVLRDANPTSGATAVAVDLFGLTPQQITQVKTAISKGLPPNANRIVYIE